MSIINPTNISEIEFDEQDTDLFKISDIKECVATLRSRLFPRLELLIKDSLELIEEIYGIDPYEGMSTSYSPGKENNEVYTVAITRSGKRRNRKNPPLAIKNAKGKPIYIHSAVLSFEIFPEGSITVVFQPFFVSVESSFVTKVRQEMYANFELLNTILTDIQIYYNSAVAETSNDFHELISGEHFNLLNEKDVQSLYFFTILYSFPTNFEDELWQLRLAFVGLYPLLDLCISIGDNKETHLTEMLNKFHEWYSRNYQTNTKGLDKNSLENIEIEDELTALPSENLERLTVEEENIESSLNFNPENLTDARKRNTTAIVQRQGQPRFRSDLLRAYGGKCSITDCDAEAGLEAAHIVPYLGDKTNCLANGLLLRADIHTLFDRYLISIDPNTNKIIVSSSLLNTCYKELNGKMLKSPQNPSAIPSPKSLAHHYEIFLSKK